MKCCRYRALNHQRDKNKKKRKKCFPFFRLLYVHDVFKAFYDLLYLRIFGYYNHHYMPYIMNHTINVVSYWQSRDIIKFIYPKNVTKFEEKYSLVRKSWNFVPMLLIKRVFMKRIQ